MLLWIKWVTAFFTPNQVKLKLLRVHLHDTIVVKDCSFWCIRLTHWCLPHVWLLYWANRKEELRLRDNNTYLRTSSPTWQSYRVKWTLLFQEECLPRPKDDGYTYKSPSFSSWSTVNGRAINHAFNISSCHSLILCVELTHCYWKFIGDFHHVIRSFSFSNNPELIVRLSMT